MNRRALFALLLAGGAGAAHADIRNLLVLDNWINSPPAGNWIDVISTSKSGRFVDADVTINGAGTCGEWQLLVDGQQAYYFDHHHQRARVALPGAPVQQIQRFDAGYLIEMARVAPPEPIHFSQLQLQYRGNASCATPTYIQARTTSDTF